MRRPERAQPDVHAFAAWVQQRAETLGYDLGPRGGGRRRLAEDAGISEHVVGRLLKAQNMPSIENLIALSDPLRVTPREILIRSRILAEEDLPLTSGQAADPTLPLQDQRRMTPDEAADALGITDPQERDTFRWMVRRMRTGETSRAHDSSGGESAER